MRRRALIPTAVLLALVAAIAAGCRKAPGTVPAPAAPPPQAVPAQPVPAPEAKKEVTESFPTQPVTSAPIAEPSVEELNRQKVLRPIHFAYDKADLDEENTAILKSNADWLKANPKRRIAIEGHCDERGTVEYNLALGERRARAARDYLVGLGVEASRVRVVSYGKERPVDPGHGDQAWAKNRRDEFVIES